MKNFVHLSLGLVFVAFAACDSTTGPEQACLDTADAVAKAGARCGQDYETNRRAFIQVAAGGDCENIVAVRDEASLRGACFESLEKASCDDLVNSKLDPSCRGQLEREE